MIKFILWVRGFSTHAAIVICIDGQLDNEYSNKMVNQTSTRKQSFLTFGTSKK